ncbi:galactose-binding domain-like protein [Mycena latifolia]|nr:galactose-binding domain-like protein [Mycena latifolia]
MAATKDDVSLLELLDLSQLNCLNESSQYPFKSIVSAKAFNQSVRVRSIVIKSSGGAQAPKKVKLLVNRPSIGFEDVEDAEEPEVAQILDISEDDIFVVSNQGGADETRIDAVDVLGVTVETTKDLSGLKKADDH